ncbi:hypothetical protein [Vulgatibacter sp.]|uniref:hypothetical protein n=1 Tax=Vulgatibacter sp. TaxID=1971226 RepID=UPI00356AB2EE
MDDLAELRWPGGTVRLLIGYKAPLLARDVPAVQKRIRDAADRWRSLSTERSQATPLPAVVTEAASPSVIEACLAEGLGVFDRRGTVVVRGPGVFIHADGKGKLPVARPARGSLFRGVAGRVARVLLADPTTPRTAQAMATLVGAGYATTFNALARLEHEGFAERLSARSGFFLRDPLRLVRAWIDSGERTAVAVEAYYAPAVTPEALARARAALDEQQVKGIWSLASGLAPDELHVSGLPHGIYLSGSSAPVERALQLRRTTPHNFLVLRAEPAAETDAGGIYMSPRTLGHGSGVSLIQLAVDCAGIGGRGPEQARFLIDRYADSIRRGDP